jgi:SNF2 family DNA or RNA helicase
MIMADVPGLGKTTSSLLCAALAREASGLRCVVVVAPLALHQQWEDEVAETFPTWRVVKWSDSTSRAVFDPAQVDVLIVGYEALAAAFKRTFEPPLNAEDKPSFKRVKASPTGDPLATGFVRTSEPRELIFKHRYAAFIADEGHRLRNDDIVSYHAAFAVAIRCHARLVLTGTPHNNLMQDVAHQMRICNGRPEFQKITNMTGVVQKAFFNRMRSTSIITHDKSYLNLPPLRHWTVPVTLKGRELGAAVSTITKALDAMKEFKRQGKGFSSVLVALTVIRKVAMSRHMRKYKAPEVRAGGEAQLADVENEQRAIAARIAADPPEKLTKAMQLIKLLVRQQRADNPELRRKVVVFCTFIPPLMALQSMLEADPEIGQGNAPMLWGKLKSSERDDLLRAPKTGLQGGRFHTDPDCKVLLANYATGGLGLNLAPAADAVVMLDVWWNPAVERQAEDRVHRLGAVNPCDVYVMMNRGSFDTSCRKLYHSFKKRNGDIIMQDKHDSQGDIIIDEGATVSLFIDIAKELSMGDLAEQFETLQGTSRISTGQPPAPVIAPALAAQQARPAQSNYPPPPRLLPRREALVPQAVSRVEPIRMLNDREESLVRSMGFMPSRLMTGGYEFN